jgi:hypothetical protein
MKFALQLLVLLNFTSCLHKIVLNCKVSVCSDCKHTSLCADNSHICSVEVFAELSNCFKVEFALLADVLSMDL